mmetsp:Transcript_2124/g.2814  ORF Transcript_2124/g.2814 Transcript_2124/m.2814 type:complete len:80 (-) Transcript_2124:34-273(-)
MVTVATMTYLVILVLHSEMIEGNIVIQDQSFELICDGDDVLTQEFITDSTTTNLTDESMHSPLASLGLQMRTTKRSQFL